MKLFIFVLFSAVTSILAQNSKDDVINSIFSSDFLADYEEVTPPPLRSIGALTKCGEGTLRDRFVCVPYYNCNPDTNTVQENPEIDGSNRINIRMQDEDEAKCDHYLEICCQIGNSNNGTTKIPQPPTTPPTNPETPQTGNTGGNPLSPRPPLRANCGIRNSAGLDFNEIAGITNEAKFGEFPWMLAILRKNPRNGDNLAICGASLIAPRVVLTGAHCVHNTSINDIKIRAGEWDTQTNNERIPYQERNVVQKIIHEHFVRGNLYNDVALLLLDRPFTKTDSVGTVCLPQQDQHFDSRECFATGWGKDRFGQKGRYAVILKKLQLPLVNNKNCQKALRTTRLGDKFILHRSFTCAGGEPDVDTCTGDGGSPLVCPDPNNPGRYLQVGIVAWGIGCGFSQVPGVYVDVANFRTWIDTKFQENSIGTDSYVQ